MRLPLCLWLLTLAPLAAIPVSTTLTLVSDPVFNRVKVTIDPGLADTETTVLTGSVVARLDIDPQTGTTTELTLSDGRTNGTDMAFARNVFGNGYNINVNDMAAAIDTVAPPGTVAPANGQFPAEQHRFAIDQGSITGNSFSLGSGSSPINQSFTPEAPATGTGTGTGTVTLTPAGDSGIHRNFTVTVTLPIAIDDTFDADGTAVAVVAGGTLKASGTVQVPRSAYLAWTIGENIAGAAFDADPEGDGVPNGVLWALGLAADADPAPYLPRPDPAVKGGFLLTLPPGGSGGPISIESSGTLATWPAVPAGDLSSAANPLPAGTTGTVSVAPDGSNRRFIRLQVEEP